MYCKVANSITSCCLSTLQTGYLFIEKIIHIFFLGRLANYVDKFLAIIDQLPSCVDIFFLMNIDKS